MGSNGNSLGTKVAECSYSDVLYSVRQVAEQVSEPVPFMCRLDSIRRHPEIPSRALGLPSCVDRSRLKDFGPIYVSSAQCS
jgi:hypothetical protein